jgi:CelD/BcsL family acetyltransferase involved in cellulose biosynthesis
MHTPTRQLLAVPTPPTAVTALLAPRTTLTVEVCRDLELRPQDAHAYDALVAGRPEAGVFLSRAWLSGLFAEPAAGSEPLLVLLREGATLRGAVPLTVTRSGSRVRVGLLGGARGSDRVDLVAARGFERVASDTLLAWLSDQYGARGLVAELRDVPAESPIWGALDRTTGPGGRRWVRQPREIHTHPYLDLTEASYRLSDGACAFGDVASFTRHYRWLEHRGRLQIDMLKEPREIVAAFDALTDFLHARFSQGASRSSLDNPRTQRFHRRVLPLLAGAGQLRLLRIAIDIRTVGVAYMLACGTWRGYYLAGYDRAWAGRIHLGRILAAVAIDRAAQEGATQFDFLKGAEPVKYSWPVRERATLDTDIYTEQPRPQLARAARAAREAMTALLKSGRGLFGQPSGTGARQPM